MNSLCLYFGEIIRRHRELRAWSQEMLAEKANLNRSYVGEVERGKVIPSILTLEKLARALDISMSDLLQQCEQLQSV